MFDLIVFLWDVLCVSKTVCVSVRLHKCVLSRHLELRRINIRNVLMSGDSCQVKWGSVMQDNRVPPATVWILQVRSEHKLKSIYTSLCGTERQNLRSKERLSSQM